MSYGGGGERNVSSGLGHGTVPEISKGLGNLADELAEVFDEDEISETCGEAPEAGFDGAKDEHHGHLSQYGDTPTLQSSHPARECSPCPPKEAIRSKYHHRQSSQCHGSEYVNDSDLEGTDGISPTLEARMAALESLVRLGTESNGSDSDDVVHRMVKCLQDLGSQSSVENSASRLITSHTALISHLANQTRVVSTLTHPFISPLSAPPHPDFVEDMLPFFTSLVVHLPAPTSQPLSSLQSLHTSTAELTTMLTYLSDTLYMTRQTASLASRRLRSTIETVAEMRKEAETREEAVRWLENGRWGRRLAERECARVCGDVIRGFEEACNTWRERLLGGLEIGAA